MVNIDKWLNDKKELENSYNYYLDKKIVLKIVPRENLFLSHFEKAEYNLKFSYFLLNEGKFFDWAIIGLYYAVYHSSLSLLLKKGFNSKNHNATLCLLIYYYTEFNQDDLNLFKDLLLKEEEVKFYSTIKYERQKANYTTGITFSKEDLEDLRSRTLKFISKVRRLLDINE